MYIDVICLRMWVVTYVSCLYLLFVGKSSVLTNCVCTMNMKKVGNKYSHVCIHLLVFIVLVSVIERCERRLSFETLDFATGGQTTFNGESSPNCIFYRSSIRF